MSLFEALKTHAPMIMGIVNVTPDSFSDGGAYETAQDAIAHGLALLDEGADILDIGGESTRPNADIVTPAEEIARVLPVIKGLSGKAPYISIDTRNAETMREALCAGANIINDVSGLMHDPHSVDVAASCDVPVCIMHMKGTPQNMQNAPVYESVLDEICAYFDERIRFCVQHNIAKERLILDPGIGFGKTLEHNLEILHNFDVFQRFECPVLLGASRKSFIGSITGENAPQDRIPGSIAAALQGVDKGAHILRVHDVAQTIQAVQVYSAMRTLS